MVIQVTVVTRRSEIEPESQASESGSGSGSVTITKVSQPAVQSSLDKPTVVGRIRDQPRWVRVWTSAYVARHRCICNVAQARTKGEGFGVSAGPGRK